MNSENKPYYKLIVIFCVWTLVLVVAQGIGICYFLTRYAANKHIAQTGVVNQQTGKLLEEMKNLANVDDLKNLESNIEKIEKEIAKLDDKYEEVLKKSATAEAGKAEAAKDALKALTPALNIKSKKPYYVNGYQIKYTYSLENKGKYAAKINNARLYLSTTRMDSSGKMGDTDADVAAKIKNQLILNKDYYLRTSKNIKDIAPGELIKNDMIIEFINPHKIPDAIYYCVTFDAQTDPNVINTLEGVDKDKIVDKKFYYIVGDIITPG
jgi:hypothetical protein